MEPDSAYVTYQQNSLLGPQGPARLSFGNVVVSSCAYN